MSLPWLGGAPGVGRVLCVPPPRCLTDAEELGVHAVEVGDEEEGDGPGGVEEEEEASGEVKHQPPAVHHQQAGHLL